MFKSSLRIVVLGIMAACIGRAVALDFTLQPITGGTFRFKDCNGQTFGASYIETYAYSNARVRVALDTQSAPYLAGTIQAAGLKPNFAYQIKLAGRNSRLSSNGDDATNEKLGLIGRWWRAFPNPANAKDDDYLAHKDDPAYAYSGYLIIGFFITDAQGSAAIHFDGDNSFHVLWRTNQRPPNLNDGPVNTFELPATSGNSAYDASIPSQPLGIYGEWEPTRAVPGTLSMPRGRYACDFILTEESFHDFGANAGNWTAAMGAAIDFNIGAPDLLAWSNPADIVYPTALSDTQLNALAPEPGYFEYSPQSGTVLNAGTHTLSVQFTPYSTRVTHPAQSVQLTVRKALPNIDWSPPQNVRANTPLDGVILNAVADVPGQFNYQPPLGTSLAAGSSTLTLQFVPNDTANYTIPAALVFHVEAVTALLITSGPSAAPNPAYAGSPVQFSAATGARGILWSWDFGDGSAQATGSVSTHGFGAPGIYTVKVSAQVPRGRSETQTFSVTVLPVPQDLLTTDGSADADSDGFCNALETAWGSDPNRAGSTPLNGLNGFSPEFLNVLKLKVRVNHFFVAAPPISPVLPVVPVAPVLPDLPVIGFVPGGRYHVELRGRISVATDFNPAGARIGISAGGFARAVMLDRRGRARVEGATVSLRLLPLDGAASGASLSVSLDGSFFQLPSELQGTAADGNTRFPTIMIVAQGRVYSAKVKTVLNNFGGPVIFTAVK